MKASPWGTKLNNLTKKECQKLKSIFRSYKYSDLYAIHYCEKQDNHKEIVALLESEIVRREVAT